VLKVHIDRELGVRTQMNVTRALVLPKKQHEREYKITSQQEHSKHYLRLGAITPSTDIAADIAAALAARLPLGRGAVENRAPTYDCCITHRIIVRFVRVNKKTLANEHEHACHWDAALLRAERRRRNASVAVHCIAHRMIVRFVYTLGRNTIRPSHTTLHYVYIRRNTKWHSHVALHYVPSQPQNNSKQSSKE
jgi:hypothetical protein